MRLSVKSEKIEDILEEGEGTINVTTAQSKEGTKEMEKPKIILDIKQLQTGDHIIKTYAHSTAESTKYS